MESCQHDWYRLVLTVEPLSSSVAAVIPKCKCLVNKLSFKRLTLVYFALFCHTILAHCSLEGTAPACTSHLALAKVLLTDCLHLQSRCMYSVQSAFLRLQKDLDPLMKTVPAPSKLLSLPSVPTQHSKLQMRRVPSNEDMHSTNRIISHVLRKVWQASAETLILTTMCKLCQQVYSWMSMPKDSCISHKHYVRSEACGA